MKVSIEIDSKEIQEELPKFSDAIHNLRITDSRVHFEKPKGEKNTVICDGIFRLLDGVSYLESKKVLDYVNQELLRKALERTN